MLLVGAPATVAFSDTTDSSATPPATTTPSTTPDTTAPDTTAPTSTVPPTTTTAPPSTTVPPTTTTTTPAGPTTTLLVRLAAGLSASDAHDAITSHGGTETSSIDALRLHVVEVPASDADAAQSAYRADSRVLSASLDKVRDAESGATDPSYGSQWALPTIGWEDVHGVVNPAGSATLAVLDTGVDASAPDLAGRLVHGWSFDGSDPATDPNGHGTHVATIAAGGADDGTGIAGVAYAGVSVMPVRVSAADGTGTDADIIEGLVYAVDHGADVVVMAFSNPGESAALQAAVDYAWSHGVVVVAAAGNDGGSTATYPAGLSKVVGVGATAQGDAVASFSNRSDAVFIAAPGTDIAASDAAGVTSMTGTSASAAVLAGSAALLRANDPSASPATIVGRLARNADATTGGSSGNGRVNLARAIADTSTDGVTPAGVPGGGGPVVGPYVTAATKNWRGCTNNGWTTSSNWRTGTSCFSGSTTQPGSTDDVFINNVTTDPTISSNVGTIQSLTVDASSTLTIGAGGSLTVSGNVTVNGTLSVTQGALSVLGNITVNSGGTLEVITGGTLTLAGNYTNNGSVGTLSDNNATLYTFNGTGAQTISGTAALQFKNMTVNKTAGSLTLGTNVTVGGTSGGTLTLTQGALTTGSNTIILLNSATTVARTSGFVDGALRKAIGGAGTVAFEVGNGSIYTPASIVFAAGSSGTFTVRSTAGEHPNVATSGITQTLDANTYWNLSSTGTINFGSSPSATFTYTGNLDPGTTPASFVAKRWSGSAWSTPTLSGTPTANSASITGLTSANLGDFIFGQSGPAVSSLSPSSLGQGATTQTVTVNGSGFVSGAVVSISGTGLTVGSTTFVNSGQLTVPVTVGGSATTGARTLTVTNPDTTTATSTFTVNAAPTVTTVSPASRGQGAPSQTVTLTGTGFRSGATVTISGTGLTVGSTNFVSSTSLTVPVAVAAGAPVGARTVTVTNPDFATPATSTFTVNQGPSVTLANPAALGAGAASQTITVTGSDFVSGATVSFSGTGLTVGSTTFVDSTTLTVPVAVSGSAATGARTVTVSNSDAGTGSAAVFTVNAGPTVATATPSLGQGAPSQTVTITGTGFVSGSVVSIGGSGLTVGSTTFVNGTTLTVPVAVDNAATTGSRSVTVTNPDFGSGSASVFTVNASPTVTTVTPDSLAQGATQNVTVNGTNFVAGTWAPTSVSFSGAGITVNSVTRASATALTVNVTIDGGAATGLRDVTVTSPDFSPAVTATNAFTVNTPATVTSISPTSLPQGATSQTITVTGADFVSGSWPNATVTFSGTGITVNSVTRTSATTLSVVVTISGVATVGTRDVTVTSPDGAPAVTLPGAFTVNAAPAISTIAPTHLGQGASGQTLTVSGSNFVAGATAAFTKPASTGSVSIGSVTFDNAGQLTLNNVAVSANATAGAWTLTVTNPDGGVATSTAFSVDVAPTVTTLSPSSRGQGASGQTVTLNGTGLLSGATVTFSKTGSTGSVTVGSVAGSGTSLTLNNLAVSADATPGAWDVTVNNNNGGPAVTGTGAFTVNAAATVSSISPTSRAQGTTNQTITVTGDNFVPGTWANSTVSFGAGVTVNSVTRSGPTSLRWS